MVKQILARIVKPLQSRKVRIALVTVIGAYIAELGLDISDEMLMTIVGVGIALILGVAHEDNGAKAAGQKVGEQ